MKLKNKLIISFLMIMAIPLFLFCVTMQNHGSYTNSDYKSEVRITYPNGNYPMAEQYLELLSESDKAFENLYECHLMIQFTDTSYPSGVREINKKFPCVKFRAV